MGKQEISRQSVVFVEAHPDDLAGSMGTALKLAEKFDVHVIDFTHGERGLGEARHLDGTCRATRIREERAVCSKAGFKLHWCDQVDGESFASREACEQLAKFLKSIRPRAVFCHWPIDSHADHYMSYAATMKAVSLAGIEPEVYFHEQDGQSRGFVREIYVDISGVGKRKDELVGLYACQNGPAIAERKAGAEMVYGRNSGMARAEIFGILHGSVRPGAGVFRELDGVRM